MRLRADRKILRPPNPHVFIGLSGAKIVDAQAGFESGIGITLGALAGINMISGPGMLDFENCQSYEKLVIDDTICGMALRLVRGIDVNDQTLGVDLIRKVGAGGHYLAQRHTMEWLSKEIFNPSDVVDRQELSLWRKRGSKDSFQRAREAAEKIIRDHEPEPLPTDIEKRLDDVARRIMKKHGIEKLPLGPNLVT